MQDSKSIFDENTEELELEFKYLVKFILRNKKFILILTLCFSFLSFGYIRLNKPLWQGSYKILFDNTLCIYCYNFSLHNI